MRFLIAAGAIIVLAIGLLAAVPFLVNLPYVQAYIAQTASHALGRPVKFEAFSLSVLPLPAIVLKEFQVAEDPRFGRVPFLRVGEGRFALRLGGLLSGRVEFGELTLDQARVELIQDESGRWNVASLGPAPGRGPAPPKPPGRGTGAAPAIAISRVQMIEGVVHYQARSRTGPSTDYRLERIRLTVRDVGGDMPVAIEGEAQINPGAVSLKLTGAVALPPGGGPLAAAPIKGRLAFETKDLAPMTASFLGPSPAVAGPVRGTLALAGTLGRPALQGEVDSARLAITERRLACPPPETRRLTLESVRFPLAYGPSRLTSRPLSATLSGGRITLSLDVVWESALLLSLREITIRGLPLGPILVDYLCQGYAVTGPLDLAGDLSVRPGDPWRTLAGQGQLRIGPGKVMGPAALALLGTAVQMGGAVSSVLNLDLPSSLFSSPLEFDSITATYRVADGRLMTEDLLYTSARMRIAAAGEYGLADGRIRFDLTLAHGRGQLRARVTGTTASPSIRVAAPRILRTDPEQVRGRLRGFLERLGK